MYRKKATTSQPPTETLWRNFIEMIFFNTLLTILSYYDQVISHNIEATNMLNTRNLFSKLPNTLVLAESSAKNNSISDYLSISEQYRLSHLDKHFHALFKKPASEYVQKFLNFVIRGDQAEVVKMLDQDPSLLLEYGTVKDYSGRTFEKRTALQLMICAKDNEMIAAIKPYFDKLHEGQNRFDKQITELEKQLPNGFSDQPGYDFSSLVKIISNSNAQDIQAALNKQQTQSPVCLALSEFRNTFTQLSISEENFNLNHMLNAFKAYENAFTGWDLDKRNLFWRQVIGFTQRFLPSNIAQDVAQGIIFRIDAHEKAQRSFNFRFGHGAIFPLSNTASLSGLGYDYAAVVGQAATQDSQLNGSDYLVLVSEVYRHWYFSELISKKNIDLEKFIPISNHPLIQEPVRHRTCTIV